ncbi:hypothetical protein D3C77_581570 [compost metagenome]
MLQPFGHPAAFYSEVIFVPITVRMRTVIKYRTGKKTKPAARCDLLHFPAVNLVITVSARYHHESPMIEFGLAALQRSSR